MMNHETPIDVVIDTLLKRLSPASSSSSTSIDLNSYYSNKEEWISICRKNLIFTLGTLCRLSTKRLSRLGLPLALEEEFERAAIASSNSNTNPQQHVFQHSQSSNPRLNFGGGGCPFHLSSQRATTPTEGRDVR